MNAWESYRILNVSPRAGWEEIRSRFRALVYECHPDRNPDDPDAAARFRQVVEAYETIRAARARSRKHHRDYYRSANFQVNDELFEEYFGISNTAKTARNNGPDFRYDLRIPFLAAVKGLETTIEVPQVQPCPHCETSGWGAGRLQICPDCQGKGYRPLAPGLLRLGPVCQRCQGKGRLVGPTCPACQGTGYQNTLRSYHLKIPAGTEDGDRLRFAGEGGRGFRNGPPGNLEVVISVEPHAFFTRKGKDLYCTLEVSFAKAALGGPVRVPTLDGYRYVYLPKGTQSGKVIRFPGAGAPGGPGQSPGDQIVEVVVTTPKGLTPDQREILKEFQQLEQKELSFAAHE